MDIGYWVQLLSLYAIPAVLAITLHEAAHGYAAKRFGDLTAFQEGRITLNPIKHVDLVGTLVVPAVLLLASGGKLAFGWAKPVPVNFSALKNPKRDMLWVAAAGPGANLVMAVGWSLLYKLTLLAPEHYFSSPLLEMSKGGILINLVLMVLNLIPVPPLDGGRIAISALPHRMAYNLAKLEPYGLLVIMLLMASGLLSTVMYPILGFLVGILSFVFGI